MLFAILSPVRDYTAMATKARLPETERHWLRVLGTLNEAQARAFVAQKANVKTIEGTLHPDRDAQFRYLNDQVRRFVRRHNPVVSVDTKKKELVGSFENRGRRWQPAGDPEAVQVHDFPAPGVGKAIPYGTYDVTRDEAVVNVGITHETAEFAVESIRRWWHLLGRKAYPKARQLLICADAGGSNGT